MTTNPDFWEWWNEFKKEHDISEYSICAIAGWAFNAGAAIEIRAQYDRKLESEGLKDDD